jgi:putative copper resistance protein D
VTFTGPVILALLHAAGVTALLVLCGTFAFRAWTLDRAATGAFARALWRIETIAAAAAFVCTAAWFLAEAALLGDARSLGQAIATLPAMLDYLGFARGLLIRLGVLVLVLAGLAPGPAAGGRGAVLFVLAGASLGIEPWLGHAGAAGGVAGAVLPGAELIHLAGAAVWFGGLPALLAVLRQGTPATIGRALRRFSAASVVAVIGIAAGGAAQGWFLVGSVAGLSGTGYGRAVLLKTALFAAVLALAAVNRLVLMPRLDGAGAAATRARLHGSVAIEAALGLAIVLTAGWLAGLAPGADHAAAARVWPWLPAALIVVVAGAGAAWFARPVAASEVRISGVAHDRPPGC